MLYLPAEDPKSEQRQVPCAAEALENSHLRIATSEAVGAGTPVTVEHDDALFLGEVLNCAEIQDGWQLDLHVEHVLNGLASLVALRDRLLDEQPRTSRTPQ